MNPLPYQNRKTKLQIWLIDEGSPGHRVQSEGVVAAVELVGYQIDLIRISCRPMLRGVLRPLAHAIISRLPASRVLSFAQRLVVFTRPEGVPDLIISSAGGSAIASYALASATGAPNVFVGAIKRVPSFWFTAVLAPLPQPQAKGTHVIETGVVPNTMTPSRCAAAADHYWNGTPPSNCWTLLVGGECRNHHFSENDFIALAKGINALSAKHGIRWLIATSRRTGIEGERLLAEHIQNNAIQELILASQDQKKVVAPFIGASHRVFVTQDSLTMLSEAIASGRLVTALVPSLVDLAPDNYMARLLRQFDALPQFSRVQIHEFANSDFADENPSHCFGDAEQSMAKAAQELLKFLHL